MITVLVFNCLPVFYELVYNIISYNSNIIKTICGMTLLLIKDFALAYIIHLPSKSKILNLLLFSVAVQLQFSHRRLKITRPFFPDEAQNMPGFLF